MITSTAVFDGFENSITNKFYNCWGHIHVMNYNPNYASFTQQAPSPYDSNLLNNLKQTPGVKSVNDFVVQSILLKSKSNIEGVLLKGINTNYDMPRLAQFIVQGRSIQFADSGYSQEILLSLMQAKTLGIQLNDNILAYFIKAQFEIPRVRKLKVVGIYETGLFENDKTFAIADDKLIANLNNDSIKNVSGYEICVNNINDITAINKNIFDTKLKAPLNSYTIKDRFKRVFQWLELVKQNLVVVYFLMLIVALINIATSVFLLITERVNMIGILKSMGANNVKIQLIFFWQSLFITIIGIASGVLLALLICGAQQYFHLITLDPSIYYVRYVQIILNPIKILKIVGLTLSIFSVLLIAITFFVRGIQPLKAIRFE